MKPFFKGLPCEAPATWPVMTPAPGILRKRVVEVSREAVEE
jgi:hypothetical protein